MSCDVFRVGWARGCTSEVKWWWREKPTDRYLWHPRCGNHARIPGNSEAERIPITEPDPNVHGKGTSR